MPCESCHVQFTVFRRKRTCSDCKRFYCNNCLTTSKRNSQIFLCERCAIFSKRPLLKTDLLQLKPKDLIFFLQSKHISTTGCVEKDELIRLVLSHVEQIDGTANVSGSHSPGSSQQSQSTQQHQQPHHQQQQQRQQNSPTDSTGNSFDSLRQTCQNFFFNITENISDSLASFDSKSNKPQPQDNNNGNQKTPGARKQRSNSATTSTTQTGHIFDQPRVSRREIPTYASSLNSGGGGGASTAPTIPTGNTNFNTNPNPNTTTIIINERTQNNQQPTTSTTTTNNIRSQSSSEEQKTSTSSSLASPVKSVSSLVSQGHGQEGADINEIVTETPINLNVPTRLSDCECSDDELFANYTHARNSLTTPQVELTTTNASNATSSQPSSSPPPPQPQPNSIPQNNLRPNGEGDEVSQSSFEELGAVGCSASVVSNDSKGTEDSGGSSNTADWQILEPQLNLNDEQDVQQQQQRPVMLQTEPSVGMATATAPPRKKLLRRRSSRQRSNASDDLNSPTTTATGTITAESVNTPMAPTAAASAVNDDVGPASAIDNDSVEMNRHRRRRRSGTCRRCGKNNLRRYVEKMRQHLESAQMSEADIKRELNEFLAYLDEQTRSVDYSETETTASPLPNELDGAGGSSSTADGSNVQIVLSPTGSRNIPFFMDFTDENDGIHVYGAEASANSTAHNPRFVNLDDYDDIKDLECLTVKQLKEVLMLHRVDYKGCCEKQELLERVERLWKNLKTAPAVDKLPTDELCKICMDAPIECVILECGHMATCTKCGKVLSECPICRQYIVRVVRFFRA